MRELWRLIPPCCGFTIPVRATPKKRHDKKGHTPLSTFVFEREVVAPIAGEAWGQAPTPRLVGLIIEFYFFDREPDQSNALKSIEDGMNGVVLVDDAKIKYSEVCMIQCTSKANERVEVQILVM